MYRPIKKQNGFSLVESLVTLGVLSSLIAYYTMSYQGQIKQAKSVDYMGNKISLQNFVRNSFSCAKTFPTPATTCTSSAYLNAYGADGGVIVAANGTKYGDYTLQAKCTNRDMFFEVDGKPLFNGIPISCYAPPPGKLAFFYQLPKTATRSRELFSQLCTQTANAAGKTGTYRVIMSLTTRWARAAADNAVGLFDARDYVNISGRIVNVLGETVANDAAQFWSINHTAIMTKLNGANPDTYAYTGSTVNGVYANSCTTADPTGAYSCNCFNLQYADHGTTWRISSGVANYYPNPSQWTANLNWAYYLATGNSGLTICTLNDYSYMPSGVYCVEQ